MADEESEEKKFTEEQYIDAIALTAHELYINESMLQRKLQIGRNTATALIYELIDDGYLVGGQLQGYGWRRIPQRTIRVNILNDSHKRAIDLVKKKLKEQLKEKGVGAFVGSHEVLGVLSEEFDEFKEAVHKNEKGWQHSELIDIAVVALLGLMSMEAIENNWK